jgi:SAM-dependent methyltransferase
VSRSPLPAAAHAVRWRCPRCANDPAASRVTLEPSGPSCSRCGAIARFVDGVFATAPGFAPEGFPAERIEVLEDVEDRLHFWAGPRRTLLERRLRRALGGRRAAAALDLGCGLGGFTDVLVRHADLVAGFDGHQSALTAAASRSPEILWLQGDVARTPFADGSFDVVCLLDVLEHAEPQPLLAEIRRLLRPGGLLLLAVPAFPALWSDLDVAAGHRCRYTRRTLRREIAAAGFAWCSSTHYQMAWLPMLWLARRVVRVAPRRQRQPSRPVATLLRAVNAIEVALAWRAPLPWGTSLLLEARAA